MTREEEREARIAEIEAKLTLSEDSLDALNTTVYRQQQLIDRLQLELRALRDQVEASAANSEPRTAADEVPPHY
jgi:SlyX protein